MTTGTPGVPDRQDPRQVVNTLKKIVNWNDAGLAAGIAFDNWLPAGAFINDVKVEIVTAFNGTTPSLTFGTNSSTFDNIVNAGDLNEGATGVTEVTRAYGRSLAAAGPVLPYVKGTLTSASAGQAIIVISYEGGFVS